MYPRILQAWHCVGCMMCRFESVTEGLVPISVSLPSPSCLPPHLETRSCSESIRYMSETSESPGEAGSFFLTLEAKDCISWGTLPLNNSWKKTDGASWRSPLSELPETLQRSRMMGGWYYTHYLISFAVLLFFWSHQTKTKHWPTRSLGAVLY